MPNVQIHTLMALLVISIGGCSSVDSVRDSNAISADLPLVQASDSRITVTLDNVVTRNGPGSWSRNADWDEYRFRVRSVSGDELRLTKVTLFDTFGDPVESHSSYGELIKATRSTKARYDSKGRPWEVPNAGTSGYLSIPNVHPAIFAANLLIFAAVVEHHHNADRELAERQTLLPALIGTGDFHVVAFFPIVPSASAVEISYLDAGVEHRLKKTIEYPAARIAQLVHRPQPRFPLEARHRGIENGHVTATLLVDEEGNVTRVHVQEASSTLLAREAISTFREYKYSKGADTRTAVEVMQFNQTSARDQSK